MLSVEFDETIFLLAAGTQGGYWVQKNPEILAPLKGPFLGSATLITTGESGNLGRLIVLFFHLADGNAGLLIDWPKGV
jgi:hypothetical protein